MVRLSGKRALMEQLIADGHTYIFGNPGTTEQAFQDILQEYPALRFTLGLHEGAVVSMADAYARGTGRPAFVELHIAPGLGNGIGMINNALQGGSPLVIYVGQSSTEALFQQPHLSGQLVEMARPVTKWAYEVLHANDVPQALRRAHKIAMTPPMGPVVLSVPIDVMDGEADVEIAPTSYVRSRARPEAGAVREAAEQLLSAQQPRLILGQQVAVAGAQEEVGTVARLLGAPIHRIFTSEPVTLPDEPLAASGVPFQGGQAVARMFADCDALLSVGAQLFRVVFPDPRNPLPPSTRVIHLDGSPWEIGKNLPNVLGIQADVKVALQELIEEIQRLQTPAQAEQARARGEALAASLRERREKQLAADRDRWDASPISVPRLMSAVVDALPPNAIVFAEASTSSRVLERYLRARPGDFYTSRGGG
ncbi:MAG: thiamine pyrophosphate-binding protein, partial [Chloroflexi bacterium]|nr:thiamine pyrophosphate-binding protein [Chloroflexota bacterium]